MISNQDEMPQFHDSQLVLEGIVAQLTEQLNALSVSNGLQAFINILHYDVGAQLPEQLNKYLDDPHHYPNQQTLFSDVYKFLPQLARHYLQEAIARDFLKIASTLKMDADSALYNKVYNIVVELYGETSEAQHDELIKQIKIISLQERLKIRYIANLSDDKKNEYDILISQLIHEDKQGDELIVLLKNKLAIDSIAIADDDKKFWRSCHSFPLIQSLNTPQKVHERMIYNVLDAVNSDFTREMIVLDDIPITFLSPNQRLFRGLQNMPDDEGAIKSFINRAHRHGQDKSLFTYKINTPWVEVADRDAWIEGSAAFASVDPRRAFGAGSYVIEFVPKVGKAVAFGKASEHELLIDQIEADEIAAIYIKGDGLYPKRLYENPNFHGIDQEYKIKSLDHNKVEFDLDAVSIDAIKQYCFIKKQHAIHYNERKGEKRHGYHEKYKDYDDFVSRYNREDVIKNRIRFYKQKGFKTYQEKLHDYEKKSHKTLAESYAEFDYKLKNNLFIDPAVIRSYKNKVDEMGQDILMLAILHKNRAMYDFLLESRFPLNRVNFNQQNLLHLAVRYEFNDVINDLIKNGVDASAKDVQSFTPLQESFNVGNIAAIDILKSSGYVISFGKNSFSDEQRIVFRLNDFSKARLIEICYGQHVDVSAIDEKRLELLCAQNTVKAFLFSHVSWDELQQIDVVRLSNFIKNLNLYNKKSRHDNLLLDLPFPVRAILATENVKRCLDITGESASIFKDCSVERINLLTSPPAQKIYALGLKVNELIGFNTDEIALLLRDEMIVEYRKGLKPSDYCGFDFNMIQQLIAHQVLSCVSMVEDKRAFLIEISSGSIQENITKYLLSQYYPHRQDEAFNLDIKKRALLIFIDPRRMVNHEHLIDLDEARIRLIVRSNLENYIVRSGLDLACFDFISLEQLKKFAYDSSPPTTNYPLVAMLGQNKIKELQESLQETKYSRSDRDFILDWAKQANQVEIITALTKIDLKDKLDFNISMLKPVIEKGKKDSAQWMTQFSNEKMKAKHMLLSNVFAEFSSPSPDLKRGYDLLQSALTNSDIAKDPNCSWILEGMIADLGRYFESSPSLEPSNKKYLGN